MGNWSGERSSHMAWSSSPAHAHTRSFQELSVDSMWPQITADPRFRAGHRILARPRADFSNDLNSFPENCLSHITEGAAMTATEHRSNFKLTIYTPYHTLMGELWGVCYKNFEENWLCHNGIALFFDMVSLQHGFKDVYTSLAIYFHFFVS